MLDAHDIFIRRYVFEKDYSKPGRLLETVKIGDVWVSRLEILPGVVTGNFYHKETNTVMFVERGKVLMGFVQTQTRQRKEIIMEPGMGIIHMPTLVATANKNIGKDTAIIILFSDRPFRSGDDYALDVLPWPPEQNGRQMKEHEKI